MSYGATRGDATSRTVIDLAVGILVGLRGCSPDDAFADLVRVVNDTRIGIGSLAGALVGLATGNSGSSAEHMEAYNAWGELLGHLRPAPAVAS